MTGGGEGRVAAVSRTLTSVTRGSRDISMERVLICGSIMAEEAGGHPSWPHTQTRGTEPLSGARASRPFARTHARTLSLTPVHIHVHDDGMDGRVILTADLPSLLFFLPHSLSSR